MTHVDEKTDAVVIPDSQIAAITHIDKTKNAMTLDVIVAQTEEQIKEIEQLALSGIVQTGGIVTGSVLSGVFITSITGNIATGIKNTGIIIT